MPSRSDPSVSTPHGLPEKFGHYRIFKRLKAMIDGDSKTECHFASSRLPVAITLEWDKPIRATRIKLHGRKVGINDPIDEGTLELTDAAGKSVWKTPLRRLFNNSSAEYPMPRDCKEFSKLVLTITKGRPAPGLSEIEVFNEHAMAEAAKLPDDLFPAAVEALIVQLGGSATREKPTGPVTGIDIRNDKFKDEHLAKLKVFPSLSGLIIASTAITDAGLVHLKNLPELRGLDIAFTAIGDVGLEHLRGMTKLNHLDLFATKVSDKGMESVKTLTGLGFLRLAGTGVTNAGLKHVGGLPELYYLHVAGPGITDEGLEHLKNLKKLVELALDGTKVTDDGVKRLKESLPQLRVRK